MKLLPCQVALAALVQYCAPVYATQYVTIEEAQQILFPKGTGFVASERRLTSVEQESIENSSGESTRESLISYWKVEENGAHGGYFFIDRVIGKHEFITYAVGYSPDHRIIGVELLEYLETKGGEIKDKSWRSQFAGKSLNDPLEVGGDILNISGATLSCVHVTNGIKKLSYILELLDAK